MDESQNRKIEESQDAEPIRVRVASVLGADRVVLNKGSADGFKYGQRFLIYAVGDEINDPETGKSLGKLEMVRGTGRVVHIQERMCTVQSDMKANPLRTIRKTTPGNSWVNLIGGLSGEVIEEQLPPTPIPFDSVAVGDQAKLV